MLNIDDVQVGSTNINPDYDANYEIVKKGLDKLYWYDKKVYEIIEGGTSIAELSKKTKISYYSLYNTSMNIKSSQKLVEEANKIIETIDAKKAKQLFENDSTFLIYI